jgi:flagellar hook-associated protein 3 FlgL
MTISTAYTYQLYNTELNSAQQNLNSATQQESTGLAINVPSDNPVGAQQVVGMQSLENSLNQYQTNLSAAKDVLTATSSALQTATTTMQSANTIAVQASNSATLDNKTKQDLIDQITTLQQSLVTTGNTQGPDGQYLFAGQSSSTQPFSVTSSGQLTFAGDNKAVTVQAGPNETVQTNVAGGQLFTAAYTALSNLKSDLESGNASAISSTDLNAVSSASSAFSNANGSVGATTDRVESLTAFNTQRITELTSSVSGIKNVNIASKASSLSLMDYLSSTNL